MTVAVLASCRRSALGTWPSCLFSAGSPWFFPGAMTGKPTIISGYGAIAQAKLPDFVKSLPAGSMTSAELFTGAPWRPLQRAKKNPSLSDLGLNPPKEEGGGDTGRSTGPVIAVVRRAIRAGTSFAFALCALFVRRRSMDWIIHMAPRKARKFTLRNSIP